MTPKSINVNFRAKQPADMELFTWAIEQLGPSDNPNSRSRLGREAFHCLRLFGSLEEAQAAKLLHARLFNLDFAELADEIAIEFIAQHTNWQIDGHNHSTLVNLIAKKLREVVK